MPWIKQGRIFHLEPAPNRSCHAQVPTPYVMEDRIRVYYACRNNGRAFIAFFDLAKDLKTILRVQYDSIMPLGRPGMFDADGVMPSCVIKKGDDLWMYYIGWSELSGRHARYQNEIGLAVSKDGGETFERMFEGPIMGRSPHEPGLAVMPFVMHEDYCRMWYQSLVEWVKMGKQYEPVYVIKYAESFDGINWERKPSQCVESRYPTEAFSRPSVVAKGPNHSMYYCYRSSNDYRGGRGSYFIGAAYTDTFDDQEYSRSDWEFPLGEKGEWDSEMTCYPYVFGLKGKLVMLYNGNGFGQTGIGVAACFS